MNNTDQSESDYLARYDVHQFDTPLVTVDVVIFTIRDECLQVLLVRRGEHPFRGEWALPGGFIDIKADADVTTSAMRTLTEKTGVKSPYLEQLQTVGNAKRDPRGWSVTVVYFALIASTDVVLQHGGTATGAQWFPVTDQGIEVPLAFDHRDLLAAALERLRNKVEYTSLPVHLLPEEFTLSDLQLSFEIVLGRKVDKSAFRRRIRDAGMIEEIPGQFRYGSNRPAQLYRLKAGDSAHYFSRSFEPRTRG